MCNHCNDDAFCENPIYFGSRRELNLQQFAEGDTDDKKDEKEETPAWATQIMNLLEKTLPSQDNKKEEDPPEVETPKGPQQIKVPPIKAPEEPEQNQPDSTKSESLEDPPTPQPKSILRWFLG